MRHWLIDAPAKPAGDAGGAAREGRRYSAVKVSAPADSKASS
jgi:hypothetical protein